MKNLQKSIFLAVPAAFLFAAQGAGTPEIPEKYYRLAIREIRGGDIVQLGEFSLYAADGSRVNGGGMELVDPCAPKSLAPGACFASQSNFPDVTADKLFDGKPLDRAWITTKEVTDGGLLELEMGAEPACEAFPARPPQTMPLDK